MSQPKILTIDIETSPNMAHVWGLWNQNIGINQLMDSGQVICWAAKWHHEDKVLFRSDFHDGHDTMIGGAWELLDQADVVIHYNGKDFDMPHLRREFWLAGTGPHSSVQEIDLLRVIKKQFRFPSNKLAYITKTIGLPTKVETGGHELWVACMRGDSKAWALMREYNKNDVVITEQLYDEVRPWIKNHPHMGLFLDRPDVCQNCGKDRFKRNGFDYTRVGKYQRFRCLNCGVESRSKKAVEYMDLRAVA